MVFGPKEALSDFAELAESLEMTTRRADLFAFSAGPTNKLEALFVALKEHSSVAVAALMMARVIVTFLRGLAERRVTITKNEKDRIISVDAKGYSPEQLVQILENCRDIIVFVPPKKPKAKAD